MDTLPKLEGIKAAFFDVDGTLLSLTQNAEPESTKDALRRLRERGIATIISTGRQEFLLHLIDLEGMSGLVLMNGQICKVNDTVIYSNPMDKVDLKAIVSQIQKGAYPALFMCENENFASDKSQRVRDVEELVHQHYEVDAVERALQENIYQINAYVYPGEEQQILDVTQNVRITRWSDLFVDVMPATGGKAKGCAKVLEALGIRPEESICFGDGENDLDMFAFCGTSVAMGNAMDSVKAKADYVTDDVDHDGIYNACVRLGLI